MFDARGLINQFLGSGSGETLSGKLSGNRDLIAGALGGGVLTALLTSGKARGLAGSVLTYGGIAALGGLAYKAYSDWKGQQAAATPPAGSAFDLEQKALPPAGDGSDLRLALVRAMIAGAKADGHIDAEEQRRLFARIEEMRLDAQAKAMVFDELSKPFDLNAIIALAANEEQAAELWLASRIAIDPDDVREKAYLDALASAWNLPSGLTEKLEAQARTLLSPQAQGG